MGRYSRTNVLWHRSKSIPGNTLWLVLLTVLSLFALPAAAAQADYTWSGLSPTSPAWSDPNNWAGHVAPAAAAGTLTFPTLTGCAAPAACYVSNNDLTGISATGLMLTNSAGQYRILGNSLTVGTGGINETPGAITSDVIDAPLILNGGQTWAIGGAKYDSLSVGGGVTDAVPGPGSALTVNFPSAGGDLFLVSSMQVGAVTVNGYGGLHIGGCPSCNTPGSVNGTNGHSLTMNSKSALVANLGARSGPLTLNGSQLLLGTNTGNTQPTSLTVNGAVTMDAATTTFTYLNDNGSVPGTDFSQLSASGAVHVSGNLVLGQGLSASTCVPLNMGDVATLFTTTGALTGTFTGIPDGTVMPMNGGSCQTTPAHVRINYTANSVTATVVSGSTPVVKGATTTTLGASDNSPAAGSSVTYTAIVTPAVSGGSQPSGTVQFLDGGTAIAGCDARPLTPGTTSSAATCTITYPSAGAHSITASYGGDGNFVGSASPAAPVTVQPSTPTPTPTPTLTPTTPPTATTSSTTPPTATAASTTTASATTATPPKPGPISASTAPATQVRTTRARLHGSVSTGGASTTWKFEYGRSTAYNSATAVQTIAAGQKTVSVSSVLQGLAPNVRYHYRLVVFSQTAVNASAQGQDLTFTTKNTGKLVGPGGRLTVIGRTILVSEKCQSNVLCTGRFSLTTKARVGKTKTLTTVVCTSAGFRIKARGNGTARVRLSSTCLSLLKPHRRLTVTYTAQPGTGQLALRMQVTLVLT